MQGNELSALLQQPGLIDRVLQPMPVGVWIMDREGRIVHGNPQGRKIWAGDLQAGIDAIGLCKGWWRGTGERIEPHEWAAVRAIRHGETCLNEEIEIECFDGTRKIILNSAMPIRNDADEIIGGLIVNIDISDRIALEDRLRTAAETDELTKAWNRRRFYEQLNDEVQRAARYGRPLSLIIVDIDHFKQINDTHGHAVGDLTLAFLCRELREGVRGFEHLARVGGDEFMLLLPETKLDGAIVVASRLHEMLASRPLDSIGPISCSIGVCEYVSGETIDAFTKRADDALYQAKAEGRGRVAVASD